MDILIKLITESWNILTDSAAYMLVGFFLAGVIKALVPDDFVVRHLGKNSFGSVLKASLLGMPLPLCSCGVVPAAAGLKQQGATNGATAAFLISTPETGVDSVAVTYALTDPLMTVIRPITAFITATITGLGINLLNRSDTPQEQGLPPAGCCARPVKGGLRQRLAAGLGYAFGDLLKDIGKWFLVGVVIAGAISAFLSTEFITTYLNGGIIPKLVMLVAAMPLYVCATASTPIAAALVLKGLSPGAALVFLMAGPATNAASLVVVARMIGKKAVAVYLAGIGVCALVLGIATDAVYQMVGWDGQTWLQGGDTEAGGLIGVVTAVVLLGLILWSYLRGKETGTADPVASCGCGQSPDTLSSNCRVR